MRTSNFLLISLVLAANTALAQQDHTCQGGHNCNEDGTVILANGDSSRLYAVGGLGDVDIADCLASYQVFILWQGVKLNPWCAADKLDAIGKHGAAAKMRCSIKAVSKIYGKKNCVDAVMYENPLPKRSLESSHNPIAQGINRSIADEQYIDQQQEQEQQIEELATGYSVLLERIEQKERADAAVAKKIRQRKAEDNVYLRELVDELKALSQPQGEATNELAKADE